MGGDTSKIVDEVKRTGSTNKATLETFNRQLDEHSTEIDNLRNSLEGNFSEIGNLTTTVNDNLGRISGLTSDFNNKFTTFEENLGSLRTDMNTGINSMADNLESVYTGLGKRVDGLETDFGALPSNVNEYASMISNNTNLLNAQTSRLDGIDGKLRDHSVRMTTLNTSMNDRINTLNNAVQGNFSSLNNNFNTLNDKLQTVVDANAYVNDGTYQTDMDNVKKMYDAQGEIITNLEKQISNITSNSGQSVIIPFNKDLQYVDCSFSRIGNVFTIKFVFPHQRQYSDNRTRILPLRPEQNGGLKKFKLLSCYLKASFASGQSREIINGNKSLNDWGDMTTISTGNLGVVEGGGGDFHKLEFQATIVYY